MVSVPCDHHCCVPPCVAYDISAGITGTTALPVALVLGTQCCDRQYVAAPRVHAIFATFMSDTAIGMVPVLYGMHRMVRVQ